MSRSTRQITLDQWGDHRERLLNDGMLEPAYGGPLARHAAQGGDQRLRRLLFDDSAAALRLWNFLLSEEDRLRQAATQGERIVGAMKDLGTVPVMAFALPGMRAFYPDGAWWVPCVMEMNDGLFAVADSLGVDDSFCPVRAMLAAFATATQFPTPDLLICSAGAVCDDFSAIAQRVEGLGRPILWWEVPHRRRPMPGEAAVLLPGGVLAPACQVALVMEELERVRHALEDLAGTQLDDAALAEGIRTANSIRLRLFRLRQLVYRAEPRPLPALEMLIAEMLALHFCSDRSECAAVLDDLLEETQRRVQEGIGALPGATRIFWINPVADLRAMNLLEACGARLCGTEWMFCHALDPLPEDCPPLEALARTALADPMVGDAVDRADRVCRDAAMAGAEAVVISRIPGASHCATEGQVIGEAVRERLGLPVIELEVPPVSDALEPALRTRLEALVETAQHQRSKAKRHFASPSTEV